MRRNDIGTRDIWNHLFKCCHLDSRLVLTHPLMGSGKPDNHPNKGNEYNNADKAFYLWFHFSVPFHNLSVKSRLQVNT